MKGCDLHIKQFKGMHNVHRIIREFLVITCKSMEVSNFFNIIGGFSLISASILLASGRMDVPLKCFV